MHLAHVSANGCMGGGWPLATPLNLALINPFDTPTFKQRGVMLVGMVTSKAWETVREGASCASMPSISYGSGEFIFDLLGLLRGWLRYSDGRGLVMSLSKGLGSCHRA